MSARMEGARPQAIDANVNSAMPTRNIRLRPN